MVLGIHHRGNMCLAGAAGPYALTAPAVRVSDVRASYTRPYRAEGRLGNLADAQRLAFTKAMKATLAEGTVKQKSRDGTDLAVARG